MITGNLKIARWIFLPEILLCFVPLSIAWLDSMFGGSGVMRLSVDVIHRGFVGVRGGVLGRPLRTHWLHIALVIGPLLYAVLFLISRFAGAGPAALRFNEGDVWRALLLLSVLPALAVDEPLPLVIRAPIRLTRECLRITA